MKRVRSANFAEMKISAYLSALSARAPSPGGGSAAALAAALGTACALKAAAFTKTQGLPPSRRKTFKAASKVLVRAFGIFERAVSRDAVAYSKVAAAVKRLSAAPSGSIKARRAAGRLVSALERAAEAPSEAAREARRAARAVVGSRRDFNPHFVSDIACAELLLASAARACALLAAENLAAARRAAPGAKK